MTDRILTFAGYWRDADGNWIRPDRMRAGGTGIRPEITLGWLFENVVPKLEYVVLKRTDGKDAPWTARVLGMREDVAFEGNCVADTPQAALISAVGKLL